MINFERLWLNGVDNRFETMSSDLISNDDAKNARHLLRKLFQVGLKQLREHPSEPPVFYLSSTRLCHDTTRASDRDVYDHAPLVDDARSFIESGGCVRVVCRQEPEPSDFLTLLTGAAVGGSDRVEVRVRSEARGGKVTFPWRDFSVCGNSYRFEVPGDNASVAEVTPPRAIACANDDDNVVERLLELFESQWDASEAPPVMSRKG